MKKRVDSTGGNDSSSHVPEPVLEKKTFQSLCIYLGLLVACGICALLAERTALAAFVEFEHFYPSVIIVESIFGCLLLPFILRPSSNAGSLLADYVILFSAGVPFIVVAAFAGATPWYAVVLSQVLVFGIWSLALGVKDVLVYRLRAPAFHLPLLALLFFGLLVAGKVLTSFSHAAGMLSAFSVPGLLLSWSEGRYFGANGWLGVAACLGALIMWSRRFTVMRVPGGSAEAGEEQ